MRKLSLLAVSFLLLILQPIGVFANTHHTHGSSIQRNVDHVKKELSDTAITTKVKAKLLADSALSGMNITVNTVSGVVTLTGRVGSEAERKLAESIAADTHGVKGVTNQLEIA